MYLRHIFRKDVAVTSYGAKRKLPQRGSPEVSESHVSSWTLNNNLKSHFRRVDFFPPTCLNTYLIVLTKLLSITVYDFEAVNTTAKFPVLFI